MTHTAALSFAQSRAPLGNHGVPQLSSASQAPGAAPASVVHSSRPSTGEAHRSEGLTQSQAYVDWRSTFFVPALDAKSTGSYIDLPSDRDAISRTEEEDL
jgi:hypothetical protein